MISLHSTPADHDDPTAMYQRLAQFEREEMEMIRKEENLTLDEDIDYYDIALNLSTETREKLARIRPPTVRWTA